MPSPSTSRPTCRSRSRALRVGDIRHNVADIQRIQALTGFEPKWNFRDGLNQFLTWAQGYEAADSGYERSLKELAERGLMGAGRSGQ